MDEIVTVSINCVEDAEDRLDIEVSEYRGKPYICARIYEGRESSMVVLEKESAIELIEGLAKTFDIGIQIGE